MRKLISAVFLALMALIQVHAQDSDLRSAPDLPTFKVTLHYSAGEGGTITTDAGADGARLAYGAKVPFAISADKGYTLDQLLVNNQAVTAEGAFDATKGTTSYTHEIASLTKETTVTASFKAKTLVKVTVDKLSATKNEITAGFQPKVTFEPVVEGQKVQYKAASGTLTDQVPAQEGAYTIVITSPETADVAELTDETNTFNVTAAQVLNFSVGNNEQGSVVAKFGTTEVKSGDEIVNDQPASFTITSNSGYYLESVTVNGEAVTTLPVGTLTDDQIVYTYTTSALTATTDVAFAFAEKEKVTVSVSGSSATDEQVRGGYQPTIKFSPEIEGQTVVFINDASKEESDKLPAIIGKYTIKLTSPETLTHARLENTSYSFIVESKKEVGALTLPAAGRIEEGEPLSMAVLTGGSAEGTTGSFVWTNPNDTASLATTTYGVTFMPEDPVLYFAKDTFIDVTVTPVYTMKVEAGNFGTVMLKGRSANDRYAENYSLEATAIADKNYTFAGWSDGDKSATRTLIAKKELELTARFDSILHTVKIGTVTGGSLKVYANGNEVEDGESFLQGTLLTIAATPGEGQMVKSVKVNGALVNTGSYVLAQAATIEAAFEAKPADTHLVNVSELKNGSVTLLNATDNAPITPGAAIAENTRVKVIGKADYGYAQKGVSVEGAAYSSADSTFTVGTADAKVTVNFKLAQFEVATKANITAAGSVSLKTLEGAAVTSPVDYQTRLVAKVETNSGYRFKSLTANSSEIHDGDTLVVSGPMTITANYIEKTALTINAKEQTVVYNKNPRSYEVKVTGGHAAKGFTVTYDTPDGGMPTNAGTYTVTIKRAEDDLYKSVEATATLVIKKAGMAVKSISLGENNKLTYELTQDVAATEWNPATTQSQLRATTGTPADNQVNVVRFTPVDATNYEPVDYYIPVGEVKNVKLTTENTYVSNGGLEVVGSDIPTGTRLTLKAIAPEGKRFVKWAGASTSTEAEIEATLTADATYTPEFADLRKPTLKNESFEFTYDGTIKTVESSKIFNETDLPEGIIVKYINKDGSSATPVNAGSYFVTVSFAGNDDWAPFTEINKSLTIKQAEIASFDAPTASELTEGQPLSASVLSGGVAKVSTTDGTTVAGIFEWAEPNKILGVGDAQSNKVKFTSYDPNYTDKAEATNANVTVKSTGASVITFEQPENGTLQVYIVDESGETEITSGTAVAPGSKLKVKVEPKEGYELEKLLVGDKETTNSTYTIDDVQGSLAIIATLKASTPDIPDVPEVPVTGVTLNATSKTIAVGESFALTATVAPSNATMRSVTWSSSDEDVATVDADGIVTAVGVGTCTITVATDDGNKTATCKVSVSTTVGIEQIAEGLRAYGIRGAVVIEPTTPVSVRIYAVTGACVYSGNISDITRIPASAGIYLIELSANGRHATTKVSVR